MRAIVCSAVLAFVAACASEGSANCTCDDTEKFDGEQCLAAADFVAPTCEPDEAAVCGCDDLNYTSSCAAFTAGVEVKYGGACRANTGSSGGGFGW